MINRPEINPPGGEEPLPGGSPEAESTMPLTQPHVFNHFSRFGLSDAPPQLRLYVRGFPDPITLDLTDMAVVGRSDPQSRILLAARLDEYGALEAGVSRQHAAFLADRQFIKVMDMGSSNGTYLNGRKLAAFAPHILRDGDELRLGNLPVRVHFG